MITQEEVQARLSLDVSKLGQAKREIQQFGETGHLGFLKASSGAKEFKKALHEVADQSPVLGLAIKALMSPIGAALGGATLAFGLVKDKLADLNKEWDAAAERMAKPIGLSKEDLEKRALAVDAAAVQFNAWMTGLHEIRDQDAKAIDRQLTANEQLYQQDLKRLELRKSLSVLQVGLASMTGMVLPSDVQAEMFNIQASYEADKRRLEQGKLQSAVDTHQKAVSDLTSKSATAETDAKTARDAQTDRERRLADLNKTIESTKEFNKEKLPETVFDKSWHQKAAGYLANVFQYDPGVAGWLIRNWSKPRLDAKNNTQQEEQDRLEATHRENLKKQLEAQRALNKEVEEGKITQENAKKKAEELNEVRKKEEEALTKAKDALRNFNNAVQAPGAPPPMPASPYTFGMAELAKYNTRYGGIAREILNREARAKFWTAAGRPDIAEDINSTIYGGEVTSRLGHYSFYQPGLYDRLPSGLTTEQTQIEQTRNMVLSIIKELQGDRNGLPVNIVNVEEE